MRRTLFGGADLDQHTAFCMSCAARGSATRSTASCPSGSPAALPELSDSAIADAAHPLDDHRRNVEELTRTVGGLAALTSLYQRYARSELRRRAIAADELVAVAARRRRVEQSAGYAERRGQQPSA